ncbi:hypothetical protein BGZ65_003892, partial [Modicella reniformis]
MYHFLCPTAQRALLDVYKEMPLPSDLSQALHSGTFDDRGKFEDAIFYSFIRHKNFTLQTTNIAGSKVAPLEIHAKYTEVLTDPPPQMIENTLVRCYKHYPRFDFIYNRTFIQVSLSEFSKHNEDSADISKAFLRPTSESS